jgi:hypothetical protein
MARLVEGLGAQRGWNLGLGLRAPWASWGACVVLAAYGCASMARDLSLYDSGELALAAVQLGLGHPPGQPLHTLLGWGLSRLPFVPVLVGVNLLSALPMALTLVPATALAQRLLGAGASPIRDRVLPWLLGAFALHPALWEPASRVEVYALATLFAVWSVALVVSSERAHWGAARPFVIGAALGACASVNPVIAACSALALAPSLFLLVRAAGARSLAALGGGALVGLSPYLYLPWVAGRSDVMVWGSPHDLASYLRYLLLRDYAHNQGIGFDGWLRHLVEWCDWALHEGLMAWLALGVVAWATAARVAVRVIGPVALALLLTFIAGNVVWHVDVPDYNGYLACAYWLLGGAALAWCLRPRRQPLQALSLTVAVALVSSVWLVEPAPFDRTRSHDRLARTLAERVLREAPPNAIVVAETDALAGALMYLQGAEHARSDLSLVVYGLASSSWYWQQLFRARPSLTRIALQDPARFPAGRAGRVRRLLDANPDRPALFERLATARDVGLRACPGGLYLRTREACAVRVRQDPEVARLFASQLRALGEGSPSAAGAIAQLSYELGQALWLLGEAEDAHAVLLAGVPGGLLPDRHAGHGLGSAPTPPPMAAGTDFVSPAALGDPARNLFLAGAIVGSAGDRVAAQRYLHAAADAGLPEARALVR